MCRVSSFVTSPHAKHAVQLQHVHKEGIVITDFSLEGHREGHFISL